MDGGGKTIYFRINLVRGMEFENNRIVNIFFKVCVCGRSSNFQLEDETERMLRIYCLDSKAILK